MRGLCCRDTSQICTIGNADLKGLMGLVEERMR